MENNDVKILPFLLTMKDISSTKMHENTIDLIIFLDVNLKITSSCRFLDTLSKLLNTDDRVAICIVNGNREI